MYLCVFLLFFLDRPSFDGRLEASTSITVYSFQILQYIEQEYFVLNLFYTEY